MAYNIVKLDLDISGTNQSNKILDEPHSLSNKPVRSVASSFGPFFAESLIVKDNANILQRGIDYQIVELHQEATLKYGKEISSVILIINSQVSGTVSITYQALGGHYCYDDTAIANMYQSVITDNRAVDWSNVLDKPVEYPPAVHRHLLEDLYGFESVVDHLERLKRAITLGQTSVVLEIINSLVGKFGTRELPKCLPSSKIVQYDALLYFLSRRKILNNIWVDTVDDFWVKGNSHEIEVDTSAYQIGTTLYWEFYNPSSNVGLFSHTSEAFKTNGGIKRISIYVPCENNTIVSPLYLGIKENLSDVDYKAVTYQIDIKENPGTDNNYGPMMFSNQDEHDDSLFLGNYAFDDELRLWHTLTNF